MVMTADTFRRKRHIDRITSMVMRDGSVKTFDEAGPALLCGLMKVLAKKPTNFFRTNSWETAEAIAQYLRKTQPNLTKWWVLQVLFPLPCHCGKPGLIRIGGETFCSKAHITAKSRQGAQRYRMGRNIVSGEISAGFKARDYRDLAQQSLRRSTKGRAHRP